MTPTDLLIDILSSGRMEGIDSIMVFTHRKEDSQIEAISGTTDGRELSAFEALAIINFMKLSFEFAVNQRWKHSDDNEL